MNQSLLDLLECPACRHALRAEGLHSDGTGNGELSCDSGHRFPIRSGIPSFADSPAYVEAFRRLRLSTAGHLPSSGDLDVEKITREEFAAQTGLEPSQFRGRTVLDAGCGGGRFTQLLARHGARVVAMDVDGVGLEQATKDVVADPQSVDFVQADLFRLPFRPRSFDLIFSLGVLHHTPDPRAAFLNLTPLLKPGGKIAVWVYPKSQRSPVSDLVRPITTRLPKKLLYWCGWAITATYGPLLRVPRLKPRLRSILYRTRLPWHDDWVWRTHSFLDWYGPRYQFKLSPEEVQQWFTDAGLTNVVRCMYETSVMGQRVPSSS